MIEHVLYRHYDADDRLLYVGITNNPGKRWGQHRRTKGWAAEVATTKLQRFDSRDALRCAEMTAIIEEKPIHNFQHSTTRPPAPPRRNIAAERRRAALAEAAAEWPALAWLTNHGYGHVSFSDLPKSALVAAAKAADAEADPVAFWANRGGWLDADRWMVTA